MIIHSFYLCQSVLNLRTSVVLCTGVVAGDPHNKGIPGNIGSRFCTPGPLPSSTTPRGCSWRQYMASRPRSRHLSGNEKKYIKHLCFVCLFVCLFCNGFVRTVFSISLIDGNSTIAWSPAVLISSSEYRNYHHHHQQQQQQCLYQHHQLLTIKTTFPSDFMMASSMETFSALLAFCEGNTPVTSGFLSQRPVTQSFDVFFGLWMIWDAIALIMKSRWCSNSLSLIEMIKRHRPGSSLVQTVTYLLCGAKPLSPAMPTIFLNET